MNTDEIEGSDEGSDGGRALAGAFTVDVEEYFHAENLRGAAPPSSWNGLARRADAACARLLDIADERGVKGTFFVLGWIAERSPRLVQRIAARGHEVASHGHGHERLDGLDPERLRRDLDRARTAIEQAAGVAVQGYRAPTWSIHPGTGWALDVLIEEGYRYDSSIFPIRHDRYGDPHAPIVPHRRVRGAGSIVEVPPLVIGLPGGARLPAAGGGYLRLFPLWVSRLAVWKAVRDGRPAVLYVHPWELDPGQPRFALPWRARFRHHVGQAGVERKLRRLLAAHRFGRLIDIVRAFEASETSREADLPLFSGR